MTPPANGPDSARQLTDPTKIAWPSRSPSGSGCDGPTFWQFHTVVLSSASALGANDFEAAVSKQYTQLKTIMGKLSKLDAAGVRMTGSGSAVYAIFRSRKERERARKVLQENRVFQGFRLLAAALVSRAAYRRLWRRQLGEHIELQDNEWPLRSRYER